MKLRITSLNRICLQSEHIDISKKCPVGYVFDKIIACHTLLTTFDAFPSLSLCKLISSSQYCFERVYLFNVQFFPVSAKKFSNFNLNNHLIIVKNFRCHFIIFTYYWLLVSLWHPKSYNHGITTRGQGLVWK